MATYGNTALDPVVDKLRQGHTIPDLGNTTASNWLDLKSLAPRIDQQRFQQACAVARIVVLNSGCALRAGPVGCRQKRGIGCL
jgi:hypothetical protein